MLITSAPHSGNSPHAVARLRAQRLAASSKPFLARGSGGVRCEACRLLARRCVCDLCPPVHTSAGMCLIMGDIEAIKPSNTGWLVADVVQDTFAFSWSRTEVDPALPALLADPQWQPYLVFPAEYAAPERVVTELVLPAPAPVAGAPRRPLFVLLDGTWSEARKMFRKSPYLNHLPVLSLHPEHMSSYRLRRSHTGQHFCTAEVAAMCLELADHPFEAKRLTAWLDVFSAHYLGARRNLPVDTQSESHQWLQGLRP